MPRPKGAKNKPKDKSVDDVTAINNDADVTEILDDALPDDLRLTIDDANTVEPVKRRMTKEEKSVAVLNEKLNAITDADYNNAMQTIKNLFAVIATKYGDRWRLTDDEALSIARPGLRVFVKYLGALQYTDEIFLGMAVIGIIVPRLKNE